MPNSGLLVPFLEYRRIGEIANAIIQKQHASRSLPIPVEEIIDVGLGIELFPLPGLTRAFGDWEDDGIVAFVNSALDSITVDQEAWDQQTPRFRFSIAHELAHVVLHREHFVKLRIDSIGTWRQAMKSIPKDQYGRLEWQANAFAGHLLAPMPELGQELRNAVERIGREGVNVKSEYVQDFIYKELGEKFKASSKVIEIRVRHEKLRM